MGNFTEAAREWLRKVRGRPAKQDEVRQLRPVALAGASRRSSHVRSQLCSSFAATVRHPSELEVERRCLERGPLGRGRRKAMSDGAVPHVAWKTCRMCERSFVGWVTSYADYCSLDCKSAALLDRDHSVYSASQ